MLVPLNDEVQMHPLIWYNVPEKPDSIFGPLTVLPFQTDVNYHIAPIENATSYNWILSSGIFGSSKSSEINLSFGPDFRSGMILASAIKDGFGESEPAELMIIADENTITKENTVETKLKVFQEQKSLVINMNAEKSQMARLCIYNLSGGLVLNETIFLNSGLNSKRLSINTIGLGFVILELRFDNQCITQKLVLF
jgi:hypothetical protein